MLLLGVDVLDGAERRDGGGGRGRDGSSFGAHTATNVNTAIDACGRHLRHVVERLLVVVVVVAGYAALVVAIVASLTAAATTSGRNRHGRRRPVELAERVARRLDHRAHLLLDGHVSLGQLDRVHLAQMVRNEKAVALAIAQSAVIFSLFCFAFNKKLTINKNNKILHDKGDVKMSRPWCFIIPVCSKVYL